MLHRVIGNPRVSWYFSKIPLFPPERASRPQAPSPFTEPPLPGAIQPQLAVGPVDDPLEREADSVAEQVMRMPAPEVSAAAAPPQVSRKCAECEGEEKLQKKPSGPAEAAAGEARAIVHQVLRSPGQPLDEATRAYFEPRFGHDFSAVRVHTGAQAAASAQALNANAYAHGRDIVFDANAYDPDTTIGRRLIAHELTHVLQQDGAAARERAQRDDKDKGKAPSFPKQGVKIVGKDADALVTILADCTGLGLKLDKDQMLTVTSKAEKKGAGISPSARAQILAMTEKPARGIIVDTGSAAPFVGEFSHDFPGFQQLDIGDVKALAVAGGEAGGATACDLVVHEVSEAFIGRGIAIEGKVKGKDIYEKAHAQALVIEAKVRADLKLGARTEKTSMEFIGIEASDTTLWLDAISFTKGKKTVSQLSLLRGTLGPEKDGTRNVEVMDIVATRVVAGEVTFAGREQAILTFNKYAADLGFKPLPVPAKAEEKKK